MASPASRLSTARTVLCTARASTLRWYHGTLGLLVCLEIIDRWGATRLLYSRDSIDDGLSPHLVFLDEHEWRPVLLLLGLAAIAAAISGGLKSALAMLVLHVSLSLRAPTFVWILDKYAQWLLVISAAMPRSASAAAAPNHRTHVYSGAVALARLQVAWIYIDAGRTFDCCRGSKAEHSPTGMTMDPTRHLLLLTSRLGSLARAAAVKLRSGAWWRPEPSQLSALDVYLRHTSGADLLRGALASAVGEEAALSLLRLLSSAAVLLEVVAPALLLLSCGVRRPSRYPRSGRLKSAGTRHALYPRSGGSNPRTRLTLVCSSLLAPSHPISHPISHPSDESDV